MSVKSGGPRQGLLRVPENGVLGGVLLLVVGWMWVLSPDRFLSGANLQTMAFQLPELGLLALAMMITLLSGGINLAIVAISNLAGIVTAMALLSWVPEMGGGWSAALGTIGALAAGLWVAWGAGWMTGWLVARAQVTPILATLGMMLFLEGVNLVLTQGRAISGLPASIGFLGNGTVAGVPVPLWIFVVAAMGMSLLLNRTPLGREVYLMGANPVATWFGGVNNRRVLFWTYIGSALLAGVAGLIMISRFNSAKAGYGQSYLLITLLAAVLGGTRATGGFGRVSGLILALLILQAVSSGLNLLRVNAYYANALWGGILLLAVWLNRWRDLAAARRDD
jgi:simple sugar transport system permease protein